MGAGNMDAARRKTLDAMSKLQSGDLHLGNAIRDLEALATVTETGRTAILAAVEAVKTARVDLRRGYDEMRADFVAR